MQDPNFVKAAFSKIADRYVVTNHVLSLGTDILWRKKVARIVRSWQPTELLDIATGTGDLALEFQRVMPDCAVTGSDFCPEMLAYATSRGVRETLVADALDLPFEDASFSVVAVAFGLRNMADYAKALQEMQRVIKPGGHLLVLDFSLPENLLRGPYTFYLDKVLPHLAGFITRQPGAYHYLSASIKTFPSGETMTSLIAEQGFDAPHAIPLSCGVASIYTAQKPL